jgi:hypothetical protein
METLLQDLRYGFRGKAFGREVRKDSAKSAKKHFDVSGGVKNDSAT